MALPDREKAERFVAYLEPIQHQLAVYCSRALNRADETADVLQSAVATAFRDFDKYSEGTNFRAWMFRYVTLETLNRNRAAMRLPSELDEQQLSAPRTLDITSFRLETLLDDPDAVLDHCDEVVAESISQLTDQECRILLLRAVGDFKYREIAEIMDIPIGTVMGLLSRARTQLRSKLLDYARQHGLLSKGDSA
ncbi:MAG: sigma-70 family RNA polymerase sigma factor [Planctomycetota bacterium]|nr:sigma-70 family RNA polymerase sigma factor [Planctomycetota bacterium]